MGAWQGGHQWTHEEGQVGELGGKVYGEVIDPQSTVNNM